MSIDKQNKSQFSTNQINTTFACADKTRKLQSFQFSCDEIHFIIYMYISMSFSFHHYKLIPIPINTHWVFKVELEKKYRFNRLQSVTVV